MDLEDLGFARQVDAHLGEQRHETLTERLQLLRRVQNFAYAEFTIGDEGHVVLKAVRGKVARLLKTAGGFVVLLGSRARRGRETDEDAHGRSSGVENADLIPLPKGARRSRERNGSGPYERLPEPGDHHKIGVLVDAGEPARAKRRQAVLRAPAVLVYAVVSAETEKAVDTFVRREDAERFLADVRSDDEELARTLRVEAIKLDA